MRTFLRPWVILLLVIIALLAGGVIYRWETTPPGPGWINFLKIRNGMTVEEVVRLMGRPKHSEPRSDGGHDVCWWSPDKAGSSRDGTIFFITTDETDRVAKVWFLTIENGVWPH